MSIAVLFLFAITTMHTTLGDKALANRTTTLQSQELSKLKAEDHKLSLQEAGLRQQEDTWNRRNINVSIVGVGLGVGVALIFGIAVFVTSSNARTKSLEARPVSDKREKISLRIRELLDQEAAARTAAALERASNAERAAGRANAVAGAERIEELRLEAQVNPRYLTVQQQRDVADACLALTGKPIVVQSYALDTEGTALAVQIATALTSTLPSVVGNFASMSPQGGLQTGIFITGPGEMEPFASCLGNALHRIAGLAVSVNGSSIGDSEVQELGSNAGSLEFEINAELAPHVQIMVAAKPFRLLR